jgi:hypothetical protein
MGANDDLTRTDTRLPGQALPTNAATVGATGGTPTVTSQTVATVPSNRARTRIGVGETVNLTCTGGTGTPTWTASPTGVGTLSATSGQNITYTAPDRANTVTITATAGASAPPIAFTIVEPSDVKLQKRPNSKANHVINTASTGVVIDVFILPADVSFQNISVQESDVNAVGTGCFQAYYANNNVGHNPNTSPTAIGPPDNDTSGSKMTGPDLADGTGSKCQGGWSWTIPWSFQVGSGSQKQFATVVQSMSITAAGQATINKVSQSQTSGATNTSAYGAATEQDPAFPGPP